MTRWVVGNLLTGQGVRALPVVSGRWSDVLNDSGLIECTVKLSDPDVARMDLANTAQPGRTFLAAVDGDTVLQAGPVWSHEFDSDARTLRLVGAGMYSYFDRRVLLPVLGAEQLPSDPATDSVYTANSLHGIAVALVEQAKTWPSGNVPVITPAPEAGGSERTYRGSDLAPVGQRLRELSEVRGGPDIRFQPRWTADRLGVEWVMLIGTPAKPLLFSAVEPTFTVGLPGSPVSRLRVGVDGGRMGSRAYSSGGRAMEEALIAKAFDPKLTSEGFPLLDLVDASRSTVKELSTLQGYADELVLRGRVPVQSWSFTHQTDQRPFLSGFSVGDFAKVRVFDSEYLTDGERRLRIMARSGDSEGRTVSVVFQPEVV